MALGDEHGDLAFARGELLDQAVLAERGQLARDVDLDDAERAFAEIEKVRAEWVIRIDGRVKARDAALVNPKIPTGEIEVYITGMTVLGQAEELPMPVFGEVDYPEETRLTYRFLDLRREKLHRNMMLRSNVVRSLRNRMWGQGFNEFRTPIITASSPEGARDFLVPSRLHPGKFYALPQAPQQFKQLIMVAGFDRYFQIAPCFRDEDPRADRLPGEFYQLDLEMSFVTQEDVFATMEPVIRGVFEEFGGGLLAALGPNLPMLEPLDELVDDRELHEVLGAPDPQDSDRFERLPRDGPDDGRGGRASGGLFSLDGVHPTTVAYGVMAQELANIMVTAGVQFDRAQVDFDRLVRRDTLVRTPPQNLDSTLGVIGWADEHLGFAKRVFGL